MQNINNENLDAIPKVVVNNTKRIIYGHPWVYSNEIKNILENKSIKPGDSVHLFNQNNKFLGSAIFNFHSLISARIFSYNKEIFNREFIKTKLIQALNSRQKIYQKPYYRLVYSDSDFLPGLIIDRFNDIFVCQLNTAGANSQKNVIISILNELFSPKLIIIRNDSPSRTLEGLDLYKDTYGDAKSTIIKIEENNVTFFIDVYNGQKTGWYFDQRENRALVNSLSKNLKIADFFCNSGGFSVQSAVHGAKEVVGFDSSKTAIDLAQKSSDYNSVSDKCKFVKTKVSNALQQLNIENKKFDIVIVDPPAFAKTKKQVKLALKSYTKLFADCINLIYPGGLLVASSCSYNIETNMFNKTISDSLNKANKKGRIIRESGQGFDHPIHPMLPYSKYLKTVTVEII